MVSNECVSVAGMGMLPKRGTNERTDVSSLNSLAPCPHELAVRDSKHSTWLACVAQRKGKQRAVATTARIIGQHFDVYFAHAPVQAVNKWRVYGGAARGVPSHARRT